MDNFNLKKYLAENKLNEISRDFSKNHILKAYALAEKLIKDMDIPDEFILNEDKFLALIKALDDKLYETAADLFAHRAGAAPDEY